MESFHHKLDHSDFVQSTQLLRGLICHGGQWRPAGHLRQSCTPRHRVHECTWRKNLSSETWLVSGPCESCGAEEPIEEAPSSPRTMFLPFLVDDRSSSSQTGSTTTAKAKNLKFSKCEKINRKERVDRDTFKLREVPGENRRALRKASGQKMWILQWLTL